VLPRTSRAWIVLVLASGLVTGCAQGVASTSFDPLVGSVVFSTDDGEVRLSFLRLADSPEERARGLMGVTDLGRDDGMLFAFPTETENGFWMKDTLIPLDVAFWGEDGVISSIVAMEPCPEEPCPTYGASEPYVYALEMRMGWFERQGVEVGDRADTRLLTY
jgi:uncharacterized membrane protein (UPF0127 family)